MHTRIDWAMKSQQPNNAGLIISSMRNVILVMSSVCSSDQRNVEKDAHYYLQMCSTKKLQSQEQTQLQITHIRHRVDRKQYMVLCYSRLLSFWVDDSANTSQICRNIVLG